MVKNTEGQQAFSIINTPMTVSAMRDNGYKSTTHALAELIDNSIEANATHIELFGLSQFSKVGQRQAVRLKELAVLDNGDGMDADILRSSLRYGIGTKRSRKGIGRFGLGLPNSSMSQARRVEVWSWQSGASNALYTWLSIDDVENGMQEIPIPQIKSVPDIYRNESLKGLQSTGTLVVWSDLDRVQWTRASTVFKHTENFIGRMYRRFLTPPSVRLHPKDMRHNEIGLQRNITLIPIELRQNNIQVIQDDIVYVRPNDPLYLMPNTSCPEDFGPGPMFQELEGSPYKVTVKYNGQEHDVLVRASYVRPHVRNPLHPKARWPQNVQGWQPGSTAWGKHADSNMGVSIVRAHREIDTDMSWINGYDPTERWWTVEIDFPTALDEIFGVTNNKQGAMTFQRLSYFDWKRLAQPGEDKPGDVRRRLEEEGDTGVLLWEVRRQIISAIKMMRTRIKQSRKGVRHPNDENTMADVKATAAINRRIKEGIISDSDKAGLRGTPQENQAAQVKSLVERYFFDEQTARAMVELTKDNKVRWIVSSQSSPAFFEVDTLPDVVQVILNDTHPVFSHLYDLIHLDNEKLSEEDMRKRLAKATAAFRILIYSWARYEDEQTDREKRKVQSTRIEWGKYAAEFFDEDDGIPGPAVMI